MWYYNRTVYSVFAGYEAQNGWGNIEGLGWRKIQTGNADGVTNVLCVLSDAAANGRRVHVLVGGNGMLIAAQLA